MGVKVTFNTYSNSELASFILYSLYPQIKIPIATVYHVGVNIYG